MLGAIKGAVKGLMQMKVLHQPFCLEKKDIFGALGEGFLPSIVLGIPIEKTHFFHALSLVVRESVGIKVKCC